MARPTTSRAKRFAQFDERAVKDLDPEAEAGVDDGSESEDGDADAGTEHYVATGKSTLRQDQVLGNKYSGVRVSRAALDDSSDGEPDDASEEDSDKEEQDSEVYDDPDTADLERDNVVGDEEIDSDDAFQEGEEESFKEKGFTFKASKSGCLVKAASSAAELLANGRPSGPVAADFMSGSEISGSEDAEEEEASDLGAEFDDDVAQLGDSGSDDSASDDEDDAGSSAEDGSEDGSDEEDDSDDEDMGGMDTGDTNSDLRKLLKQEQAAQRDILSGVSQAVKADAEKGVAVRQQRHTYDSLLNLRIRLQKGLVAVNSIGQATNDDSSNDEDKQPYEAAEEAAIKLWTAIDSFRTNLLLEPTPGQKRKRPHDASTSNQELWEAMQATEERASARRKKVLEKWSQKVKAMTTNATKTRQLGAAAGSQSLVSVLDKQLLSADHLVKRTHVPRSCAPIQASKKVAEDVSIYDDADFYQLLLKELVDQRSSDGAHRSGAPTVRYTAIKEAKTRKQVDRRASKGRKLRFTVHEKVENFMAPEDRRMWEEDAIDRLFGTLFGQRLGLKEDVSEDEDERDMAEEGLKLFRS